MPNLPPGVASMLHPQYVAAAGLAPAAAFYGLQQPMYGAYGNTGLEDLAAMQRASASAAGLHTLVGSAAAQAAAAAQQPVSTALQSAAIKVVIASNFSKDKILIFYSIFISMSYHFIVFLLYFTIDLEVSLNQLCVH